jgi:hypothetical protein
MKLFHVEPQFKTLFRKGFLVFVICMFVGACVKPQHSMEIQDYTLVGNGKPILGKEKGLTAFLFEGNPRKIPFQQFLGNKYGVGSYTDISYNVTVDDYQFKVYLYEYAEIEKYFDLSQYMVTVNETDANIVGSKVKFIALSIVNNANEDCLQQGSLYQQIAIKYLKSLKDEYNNL